MIETNARDLTGSGTSDGVKFAPSKKESYHGIGRVEEIFGYRNVS